MSEPSDLGTPEPRRRGRPLKPGQPPADLPPLPQLRPPEPPPAELARPMPAQPEPAHTATASELAEYRRLLEEKARRAIEALSLYEPLPAQEEFHASHARYRLLRGSNRAGKTLSAAAEFARAVCGRDPHGKYPVADGRAYVIGKDEKQTGEVLYRKLFRPGAFKIIRDAATGKWRAWRPWEPDDKAREKEAKPAPPLIPPRMVKSVAWRNKGANIPEKITLTNGWEIDFWSSLSKPPRGSDLDLVWLDEEIIDSDWLPEMVARLLDRRGRLMWGATPQTGSDRLYEFHCRCEEEWEAWRQAGFPADKPPENREFVILLRDNPFIDEAAKEGLKRQLTEDDAKVRIDGGFAIEASKVWPEYSPKVHDVPYFDIPPDWTRFAITDPGRQVCAVLFAAVPRPWSKFPIRLGKDDEPVCVDVRDDLYVFLYDELYIQACDAATYGERMRLKCLGQHFEAFVIDHHGGRLTDIGSGRSVEEQYSAALEKHGVRCERTGSRFQWGADNIDGGLEAVRGMLRVREGGYPTLFTVDVKNKLPNLKWEIERYRYKRTAGVTTEKPEDRGRVHLMACLRYLSLSGPRWVAPPPGRKLANTPYAHFQAKMAAKRKKAGGGGGITLGPSRPQ